MSEAPSSSPDVAELARRLRAALDALATDERALDSPKIDAEALREVIERVWRYASPPASPPGNSPLRALGGRVARRLARVVSQRQRSFHEASVEALRALGEAVIELARWQETACRALDRDLRALRATAYRRVAPARHGPVNGKARHARYLSVLTAVDAGVIGRSVLDLSCGHGEWLTLLRDAGIPSRGIDIDPAAVGFCRERGLDAIEAFPVTYLPTVSAASLGAITAFHVLERAPLAELLRVLDESRRVLVPGGILVCEMADPLAGTDARVVTPLTSTVAAFLLETRGFREVRTLPAEADGASEMDYAVVGLKP